MPNFTFTRDIPNGPNNPSADQPIMQTNANSTDSILDIDLFGFNDNNGGLHQKSTYVVQGSDPVPVNTNGAQAITYAKTIGSIAELFITRFGSATPIQLTSGATPVIATNGSTFLAGGLILKWGNGAGNGGTSQTINFAAKTGTAFPNNGFVAFAIMNNNNRSIQVGSVNASTMQVTAFVGSTPNNFGAGDAFFWLAIGN